MICLSSELTADIKSYTTKYFIVPNGIKKVNGTEAIKTKDQSSYKIVYLSNFIRSKGILDLIVALNIVRQRGSDFSISLIGKDGDVSASELMEYLSEMQLDTSVEHIGPLYDDAKYKELATSDLLVFPTRYKNEAFPLVLIEAMQSSLPVVSTMEGGIPSLVDDGTTGYLVQGGNNKALAEKIEHLIQNPEISREMGLAGKQKYLSQYTMEVFEQNLIRVLKEILNLNSSTKA